MGAESTPTPPQRQRLCHCFRGCCFSTGSTGTKAQSAQWQRKIGQGLGCCAQYAANTRPPLTCLLPLGCCAQHAAHIHALPSPASPLWRLQDQGRPHQLQHRGEGGAHPAIVQHFMVEEALEQPRGQLEGEGRGEGWGARLRRRWSRHRQ